METMQWTFVDKSDYEARGEWDSEPDKMQWRDEATGLACLIHRGPVGALCGYVGVPPGHHHFGKDYNDVDARAHGGLTFSAKCGETRENGSGICHVAPGEPELWWLGFDCAHCDDLSPQMTSHYGSEIYRNIDYVKRECARLAAQLVVA